MSYNNKAQPIKCWAEDDRPREKLMHLGRHALSNAELMAIIIGSGTRTMSAVSVSRQILTSVGQRLDGLSRASVEQLTQIDGIGMTKATKILAALELGKRLEAEDIKTTQKITSSRDIYRLMAPILSDLPHEEFHVIYLNRGNKVVKKVQISRGGISGTVADARLIFKPALELLASNIILCHNHPSGNIKPSESDIKLTNKLVQAGKLIDVAVLDHLIIGERQYYSFMDEGLMKFA